MCDLQYIRHSFQESSFQAVLMDQPQFPMVGHNGSFLLAHVKPYMGVPAGWPSTWSLRGLSSFWLRGLSPSRSLEFSPFSQPVGEGAWHTLNLTIWLRSDIFHFHALSNGKKGHHLNASRLRCGPGLGSTHSVHRPSASTSATVGHVYVFRRVVELLGLCD